MARSRIYENQVVDSDFLSEIEAASISGVLNTKLSNHTSDSSKHREIDDFSISSTALWSSQKVNSDLTTVSGSLRASFNLLENQIDGTTTSGSLYDILYVNGNVIFGSQFDDVISNGVSSTNALTWQNKVTLTTDTMPSGTYRVGFSYQWAQDKISTEFNGRVRVTGSGIDQTVYNQAQQPIKQDYYEIVSGFMYGILEEDGILNITIDYRSTASATVAYIKNAMLDIWRVY